MKKLAVVLSILTMVVLFTECMGIQNFGSSGWLVFNRHQPMITEQYTSTGSL